MEHLIIEMNYSPNRISTQTPYYEAITIKNGNINNMMFRAFCIDEGHVNNEERNLILSKTKEELIKIYDSYQNEINFGEINGIPLETIEKSIRTFRYDRIKKIREKKIVS